MTDTPTRPRGFAAMTAEKRSEIASSGGRAAHAGGKAHQFTSEEAKAAAAKSAPKDAADAVLADIAKNGPGHSADPKPKRGRKTATA